MKGGAGRRTGLRFDNPQTQSSEWEAWEEEVSLQARPSQVREN